MFPFSVLADAGDDVHTNVSFQTLRHHKNMQTTEKAPQLGCFYYLPEYPAIGSIQLRHKLLYIIYSKAHWEERMKKLSGWTLCTGKMSFKELRERLLDLAQTLHNCFRDRLLLFGCRGIVIVTEQAFAT